jgi:GDP-L-fucose synthase
VTVLKARILVCGATGFLGRNVAECFAEDESLSVRGVFHNRPPFENPSIEWVQADLTRHDDVEKVMEGVNIVVQMASVTSGAKDIVSRPFIHITDTAVMNSLLLRSAFEHKIEHFIFPSCTVMYPTSDKPLKETDFNADTNIHPKYFGVAWNKVYVEKMCEFFSTQGSTRFTVLRHSNVFGPHDKYDLEKSHVFGATVTKVLQASNPGKLVAWGEGKEERDLLYISDLVEFVRLAIEKQKEPYFLCNVGQGESISVRDMIRKVIDASGKEISLEFDKTKPSIDIKIALDSTLAEQRLGWAPVVTLDEGIQKTLAWCEENVSFK